MAGKLDGKKIAILATDGFEQSELIEPKRALDEAGADTEVVSLENGSIKGWNHGEWGESVDVDGALGNIDRAQYDALMVPGGVMNPDTMRMDSRAVDFVKSFFKDGKPVAAICHAPWMLVEADCVRERKLTSWPSLTTDIRNAGGNHVDEQVVVCTNGPNTLVTSRKPDDIPAFNEKMIDIFAQA
jgi:protease I